MARSSSTSGDFGSNVTQNAGDVNTENASSIGVDTDNPLYRFGVEEADYGEADTDPIDESVSINRYDVTEIKGNQAKTNGLLQRRFQDENENTPASASLISNGNVPQNTVNVNTENASSIGVDTDNPIYRSGVEEADYGETLSDGYSEYDIVQEMLSDDRGTMNDFKGNTKLKAELDEEVRKQVGERRTGTGEREHWS